MGLLFRWHISCFEVDALTIFKTTLTELWLIILPSLFYLILLQMVEIDFAMMQVLFQNDSPATLLARVIGIIGPIAQSMLAKGRDTYKYFTKNHMLYERNQVKVIIWNTVSN